MRAFTAHFIYYTTACPMSKSCRPFTSSFHVHAAAEQMSLRFCHPLFQQPVEKPQSFAVGRKRGSKSINICSSGIGSKTQLLTVLSLLPSFLPGGRCYKHLSQSAVQSTAVFRQACRTGLDPGAPNSPKKALFLYFKPRKSVFCIYLEP